jgi:parvulin-like peptidyl-prolyl isomerase
MNSVRIFALFLVWAFLSLFLSACSESGTPTPTLIGAGVPPTIAPRPTPTPPTNTRLGYTESSVAIVNNKEISATEFNMALDQLRVLSEEQAGGVLDWNTAENKKLLGDLRLQALEGLINYTVVEQEAKKEGLSVPEAEVQARIEEQKKQLGGESGLNVYLARRFMSLEDNKRTMAQGLLFEKMQEKHSKTEDKGEQAKTRHILVASEPEAKQVLDKLRAGGDFNALAAQFSLDGETAKNGGDLDWVFRGQTDPAFEQVVFSIRLNEYSNPVKTKFGWHILQVTAREVRPFPPDLIAERRSDSFTAYIKALRDKANIQKLLK